MATKNYGMDLEKTLKIISVIGTSTGNAHKAICYEVDRDFFRKRLAIEHKEAERVLHLFSLAKIILIEDMDLSVHILNYRHHLDSFKDMDIYYAFFDVLATCMSGSVRLTQESFHQECYTQKMVSSPKSTTLDYIELRRGAIAGDENVLKRVKALGRVKKLDFNNIIHRKLNKSIVGLFLTVFEHRLISLIFWDEKCVLGLMLSDYNTIPLKLNYNVYENIKNLVGYVDKEKEQEDIKN